MQLTFDAVLNMIANSLFGGSLTLASLTIMVGAWAVCAVICMNMKAPASYSVVPMIPIAIFFAAYGALNELVAGVIIVVVAVLVASEFKKVVD